MMKQFKMFWVITIWSSVVFADSIVIDAYNEQRDWPAIEQIIADNFYLMAYESDGVSPDGTTKSYLTNPNYKTKVVRVNDQTVGFINYAAFKVCESGSNVVPYGFINLLGIVDEHHRKGYGTLILKNAIESLKECGMPTIFIYVTPKNSKALKLYESLGFGFIAADNYFDDELDFLFQLTLAGN